MQAICSGDESQERSRGTELRAALWRWLLTRASSQITGFCAWAIHQIPKPRIWRTCQEGVENGMFMGGLSVCRVQHTDRTECMCTWR